MADGSDKVATFTLNMGGDLDTSAKSSAEALEELRAKMLEGTESLRDYQKAMSRVKGAGVEAAPAILGMKTQMAALKSEIGKAQLEYLKLGGSLKNLRPAKMLAAGKAEKPQKAMSDLRPARGAVDSTKELTQATALLRREIVAIIPGANRIPGAFNSIKIFGGGARVAIVGMTTALVALSAVALAAFASIGKYGASVLFARRAENLQLQGLVAMPNYWGRAAGSVDQMQASLDRVGEKFADRDALVGYQKSLYQMGLRGNALDKALEGVAIAGAGANEEGVAFAKAWLVGGGRVGSSIDKTVTMLKSRFGAAAKAQMLSIDNQMLRLKSNIGKLFQGLKIEHFLEQLSYVIGLFSKTSVMGKAISEIIERMFRGSSAESFGKTVKAVFNGIVIGSLIVEGAWLRLKIASKNTFGDSEFLDNFDIMNVAIGTTVDILGALVGAVVIVGAAFLVAAKAIGWMTSQFVWAYDNFGKLDWAQLGSDLVLGIVYGIKSGVGKAFGAIKDLAVGMSKTFTDFWQIKSPSRKMLGFGRHLTAGAAIGIRAGVSAPIREMRRMSEDMDPDRGEYSSRAPRNIPNSRSSATTVQVTIQNMTVGSADQGQSFVEQLAKALETISIQVAAVPG